MANLEHVGPWLRTVRHLRPVQVAHRVRLRAQRQVDPYLPIYGRSPSGLRGGWPDKFVSVDSQMEHTDAEAIAAGDFTFLNERRSLGTPADWTQADAAHLWRFNLHYMEWAWALATEGRQDDFDRLWRSWSSAVTFAHRDAWSPYVASLRAWVLCDTFESLVRGTSLEDEILRALWQHRLFLRTHLELDVGGNHLLKNIKALLGLAAFFDDRAGWAKAARRLERELEIQVLADGGHYELSPSYHCQVLGDLLDIARLQEAEGLAPVAALADTIDRMRYWLGAMIGSNDELPMFNDCWQVGAEQLALLEPNRRADRLIVLVDSGYVVMNPSPEVHLVVDVGDPCPPSLPAHAHADCLSFELWLSGERVIVDAGTTTYEGGPRRSWERSTAAHNTVTVDGHDQTEVWGAFRAGRRAHGRLERAEDDGTVLALVASHDGYRHLDGSPIHARRISLTSNQLHVADVFDGAGVHYVQGSLYFARNVTKPIEVSSANGTIESQIGAFSSAFGSINEIDRMTVFEGSRELPIEVAWSLRW